MPRVLIVDGDEATRETLAIFTEMLGIEPMVAINPSSCDVYSPAPKECSKENACTDILILNQHIPSMSGLELIQRQVELGCKRAPNHKAIMSETMTVEEIGLAKEIGCHVLPKPVTFEILENLITSVDDNAQTQELGGDQTPS